MPQIEVLAIESVLTIAGRKVRLRTLHDEVAVTLTIGRSGPVDFRLPCADVLDLARFGQTILKQAEALEGWRWTARWARFWTGIVLACGERERLRRKTG